MLARQPMVDLLVLAMVAANALVGPAMLSVDAQGWWAATAGLFGTSAVVWISLALAARRFWLELAPVPAKDPDVEPLGPLRPVCVFLVAVGCLLPSAQVAWGMGALYFLARLMARRGAGVRLSTGCLIAFAVCVRVPVTWVLTTVFAEDLLQVDAVLSGLLASLVAPIQSIDGNIVVNASGHRLFVMTGCSSLNNLSLAILFWFAVTRGLLPSGSRPPVGHLLLLAGLVVAINVTRLGAMALSPATYAWLHDGSGADVVLGLTAATVAALTILSLGRAGNARIPA